MALPKVPPFLPNVLGSAADTRDIPDTTPTGSGQVSYQSGFPPITAVPLTAGGIAPQREDFNAVNKLFSQHLHFNQSGGTYPWQNDVDYIFGCYVLGPDNQRYTCIAPNGPSTSAGAVDPSTPEAYQYWQLFDPSQTNDFLRTSTIYLNAATGDDTLDSGRGLSEDKPFKTLQAAWKYGLNKFYRNNVMLIFKFAAGNYGSSDEYYTFRQQRNITWQGDSSDPDGVVISCICIGLEQSYNIHFSNISFKFYGAVGGAPFRVMYGSYVRCDGYIGWQVMSENTNAEYVVSVSTASALDCGYPSEQYEWNVVCGKAGLNVFDLSNHSALQLDGIKLSISGQAPANICSLTRNCNADLNWITFTMNATPVKIATVSKNSQFSLSAEGATCSSITPVTVNDSSTYSGNAKSPNYNAAIRVNDVTNWESTAQMHNNIYRGANLLDGHFSSIADIMAAVRKGDFSDIYVGDYIPASFSCSIDTSVKSTNFRIAAINLLNARNGAWGTTSPNLCIVPDKLGSAYMSSTNTAEGGYVGSYMYKTVLPAYYTAIAGKSGTPFYGYIKTTTERLSTGIGTTKVVSGYSGWTGAVSSAGDYSNQTLVLLNEPEVFGCKHWSSSEYDAETIPVQLPMFRLNPATITNNGSLWWWLRAVASGAHFCGVTGALYGACYNASSVCGVRPRFFIA